LRCPARNDLRGEVRPGHGTPNEKSVMKKLLVVGVLALAALAAAEQNASAWCNLKFSCGANLSYTSGGKSLLWGAYTSQNPPLDFGYAYGNGFGSAPYGAYGALGGHPVSTSDPGATGTPAAKTQTVDYQYLNYGGSGYVPVGYYPMAGYGYYQAPSYWYGR